MTDLSRERDDERDNYSMGAGDELVEGAIEGIAAETDAPLQLAVADADGYSRPRSVVPNRRCGSF